jgi:MFS family permease
MSPSVQVEPLRQVPVRMLLAASFLTAFSRAVTLPFLAIYLASVFSLTQTQVGYLLTISLVLASLTGVYGGYLVDRCALRPLLLAGLMAAALAAASIPYLHGPVAVLCALTLANAALSLIDIGIKSAFAHWLDEAGRLKAFSARYLFNNIGYAVGPMVGALLISTGHGALFGVSGVLCALAVLPLLYAGPALAGVRPAGVKVAPGFVATLAVLRRDRQLVVFTLAGLLLAVVYGRFSSYLAQYLTLVADPETAYRTVGTVITVNALMVIALQYTVGSRIHHKTLLAWQLVGTALLGGGLVGFGLSQSLPVWVVAMVIFTLGEVIVVPAAYLFIDHIAPDEMKGAYYGVQNLATLGSAASPLLCGVLLDAGHAQGMFHALLLCAVVSAVLYGAGVRLQPLAQQSKLP